MVTSALISYLPSFLCCFMSQFVSNILQRVLLEDSLQSSSSDSLAQLFVSFLDQLQPLLQPLLTQTEKYPQINIIGIVYYYMPLFLSMYMFVFACITYLHVYNPFILDSISYLYMNS